MTAFLPRLINCRMPLLIGDTQVTLIYALNYRSFKRLYWPSQHKTVNMVTGGHCLTFDLSTQSLKVIVTDERFEIIYQDALNFDVDLPEFKTENGVHRGRDKREITSPTLMWVKAVDLVLMKMLMDGVDFSSIQLISGAAQQHGSVYWKKSSEVTLKHLNEDETLADQLQNCFVVYDSPVWMDSSTTTYCEKLEEAVGGCKQLAQITGSKAYERFTGNQIAKLYDNTKDGYLNCERISLVSSFLASLFLGRHANIDYSDGSGMNLLNLQTKQWHTKLLGVCAPGLAVRLGNPVASSSILGNISSYMKNRYSFSPSCSVVAFTGDNPASLSGMRLSDGDVAISLGTSDTLLFWTSEQSSSPEGHVFINPLDKDMYMAMLCFKNGSLSRENVCNSFCDGSWERFNAYLSETPAGNHGKLAIYFDEMEILPHAVGIYRWNGNNELVSSFEDPATEVRAILEGQFLAKRYHARKFNFSADKSSRILATGGASKNPSILQVLSDVFQLPVYICGETSNSACLGCAYRCKQATVGDGKTSYLDVIKDIKAHHKICEPNRTHESVYEQLLSRYETFEQYVEQLSNKST